MIILNESDIVCWDQIRCFLAPIWAMHLAHRPACRLLSQRRPHQIVILKRSLAASNDPTRHRFRNGNKDVHVPKLQAAFADDLFALENWMAIERLCNLPESSNCLVKACHCRRIAVQRPALDALIDVVTVANSQAICELRHTSRINQHDFPSGGLCECRACSASCHR